MRNRLKLLAILLLTPACGGDPATDRDAAAPTDGSFGGGDAGEGADSGGVVDAGPGTTDAGGVVDAGPGPDAQPLSYTPVFVRDFEQGTVGAQAIGSDAFTGEAGNSTYTTENNNPAWGNQCCNAHAIKGDEGFGKWGGGVDLPNIPTTEGSEFWFKGDFYFPAGFDWTAGGVGLKTLRVNLKTSSGAHVGYYDVLINGGSGATATGITSTYGEVVPSFFTVPGNGYPDYNYKSNGPAFGHDEWVTIEMYVKMSTVDGAGAFRTWINGKLSYELTSLKTVPANNDYLDFVYVFTYWNASGTTLYPNKTQDCQIDNLIFTTETPSGLDSHGNPMIGPGLGL